MCLMFMVIIIYFDVKFPCQGRTKMRNYSNILCVVRMCAFGAETVQMVMEFYLNLFEIF
jgi:hypothetical protein